MATLLLADDYPIVRIGLRTVLEQDKSFRVVGEAKNAEEAVQMAEKLKPDVVVVSLVLPDLNWIDTTKQITEKSPTTKVAMLTVYSDTQNAMTAVKSGAMAYIPKSSGPSEILAAVRKASKGERFTDPPLPESAIQSHTRSFVRALDPYSKLTAREREVLHMAAEGMTNPQIAVRLAISPRTVETHRANLMRKLGLSNQSDLVRYAIRHGITPMG